MAHRAFMRAIENIQPSGITGTYQIIAPVSFFDDVGERIDGNYIAVNVNFSTMNTAQIEAAIVAAIEQLGTAMGYTVRGNTNSILIPGIVKA